MSTPLPTTQFDSQTLSAAFAQIVRARRSVRGFTPEPVPQATIEAIFDLAQWAPSNCNVQPWIVHVVSGQALARTRTAMLEAFNSGQMTPDFPFLGSYPPGIYKGRQNDSAKVLYNAMGIAREDKLGRIAGIMRNYELFGAPHSAFVFIDEQLGLREATDCGMYGQTLMLALMSHGIASCPQAATSFVAAPIREQLGIPANFKLLFGISFGYEDTSVPANAARVGRTALTESTTFHD